MGLVLVKFGFLVVLLQVAQRVMYVAGIEQLNIQMGFF